MNYSEEEGGFDLVIVNDNVEKAGQGLREFILPFVENIIGRKDN